MKINYEKYSTKYTDKKLFEKLKKFAIKAGRKVVYVALLLYYTLQKDNVPRKVKAIIIGALGYFISPFDAIPDFIPFFGYTDDFGVFMMALAVVSIYIDAEIKHKAKSRLESWLGEVDDSELEEVNARL